MSKLTDRQDALWSEGWATWGEDYDAFGARGWSWKRIVADAEKQMPGSRIYDLKVIDKDHAYAKITHGGVTEWASFAPKILLKPGGSGAYKRPALWAFHPKEPTFGDTGFGGKGTRAFFDKGYAAMEFVMVHRAKGHVVGHPVNPYQPGSWQLNAWLRGAAAAHAEFRHRKGSRKGSAFGARRGRHVRYWPDGTPRQNERERELWVANDAGLYYAQRRSRMSVRNFVRTHAHMIDRHIAGKIG
jgi:hypothetical protein